MSTRGVWIACFVLALLGCEDSARESAGSLPKLRINARAGSRGSHVGVFEPATATWRLRLQRPGWNEPDEERTFVFGAPGDTPVVGNWEGTETYAPGTFRAGLWSLGFALEGTPRLTFRYGQEGDLPVVGDWDGDGLVTVGVFRNGTFLLRNSNSAGPDDVVLPFGAPGDLPVAGDWNGDGIDTVGVYKPGDGTFVLLDEEDAETTVALGVRGAQPVVGDWDDNRRDTVGVRLLSDWTLLNDHREWLSRGQRENYAADGLPAAEVYGLGEIALAFGGNDAVPVTGRWSAGAGRGAPPVSAELREFFPLAADYQNPDSFERWRDAGINTVIRVRSASDPAPASPEEVERWTAKANELGLKMIREPRLALAADNAEPNLLAFLLKDEPDIQTRDPYLEIEETARRLRAEGMRARPIFVNFAGWSVLRQHDPSLKYGQGDRPGPDFYKRYLELEDWASQDIYAISQMLTQAGLSVDDALATLPLTFDKLRRWAANKPQFAFIETSQHNDNSARPRELTADEFRAQVWLALVGGVRGIFYFSADDCGRIVNGEKVPQCTTPDGTRPEVGAAMRELNARISALTHVLQGEINPPAFSISAAAPLETAWRASEDGNYIIAVNATGSSVERWIRIEGKLARGPVEVLDEQRLIETEAGYVFRDRFAPYEARVYRFF